MGIAGKDVLLEHGANGLFELLDLNIAKCKLMVAASDKEKLVQNTLIQANTRNRGDFLPQHRAIVFSISPSGLFLLFMIGAYSVGGNL
jgi:ATP phosphoribosyltransferase